MQLKWKIGLIVVSLASALALSVGFTQATLPTAHHLMLTTGDYPVNDYMKAGWLKQFGLNSDGGVSLDAFLKLSPVMGNPKAQDASATIVLTTPNGTYPIKIWPKESLSLVKLPDGTPLYYGMLAGTVNVKGVDEDTAMLVAFSLDGTKQYMTVAIGGHGGGTEFVFGKSFFNKDIMTYIKGQLAQ
jgi:hypothetical protein